MSELLEIHTTQDGSRTLYSNQYQQSFHSMHGALAEAKHVFLEGTRLTELFKSRKEVAILEVGFGTGLNWLLTASLALHHRVSITYTGLDFQIPSADLLSRLSYADLIGDPSLSEHLIEWRRTFDGQIPCGTYQLPHECDSILQLHIGEATTANFSPNTYDCIYLDAFDPRANPELWTLNFLRQLYDALRGGSYLATYSAAGHVRRSLVASGFSVIRRPGPRGKREVLAACKPNPNSP
ncbi:MAG: tRNA (5-methylaminomethyl-2-thiouridine)(34)-methyltransferase MnmD [Bacteroidota bacterium]|nr:tRNA (5-methylaminomethyl-2-thiouridine)(34)-methyltransferase MnmD [Bacteroidota bacterium]MXW32818.1 tRNA (5-methylaminomethyl-2-thiouridine)(34)-methyltransferase MnmD [Rhodothermaceae bacterium]MDE2644355.1 tRNA (5-methylaminomethyl-2-thiouridine)(34)-methyltransferase MnmD [Bacteroidota bacterium]MXZ17075.1 tRNA (5-methylaminomethyl-2-thiouridine)(34)-methyltransferase MnmD [Rhodothermaceae bacterium]MYE62637.1 tRNA (5-methylaminomethyl-2-thiouridine)(34)-methyltransferase MnmD [Rhodoth